MASVDSIENQIKELILQFKDQTSLNEIQEIQKKLFEVYLKDINASNKFLIDTVKNQQETDFIRFKCLAQFDQIHVITENDDIVDQFKDTVTETLQSLLEILFQEPKRPLRVKIAKLLGLLQNIQDEEFYYEKIKEFLKDGIDIQQQDAALQLLSQSVAYDPDKYSEHTNEILIIILKFLQQEDIMLKTSAFSVLTSYYSDFSKPVQQKINKDGGNILVKLLKDSVEEGGPLAEEVLNNFQIMVEDELQFFKAHFDLYFDQIIELGQNQSLKKSLRIESIRILVIYLEIYGKFPQTRGKQYSKVFLKAYFTLLMPDYDTVSDDFNEAIVDITTLQEYVPNKLLQYLDIIFEKSKGKSIMPVYEELYQEYIKKDDWKSKYASVVSLSQIGEHAEDKTFILQQIPQLTQLLTHENVALKFATCHTLGQLGDDMREEILEKYSDLIMDSFTKTINNEQSTAVQAHAITALANVIEHAREIPEFDGQYSKIENLIVKVIKTIKETQSMYLKENSVQFLSASAECLTKDFDQFKVQVFNLVKEEMSIYQGSNFAQFRGQCIECISLMGVHLKELFKDQITEFINVLLSQSKDQLEEYENPTLQYVVRAFRTIFIDLKIHKEQLTSLVPEMVKFLEEIRQIIITNTTKSKEQYFTVLSKKEKEDEEGEDEEDEQKAALKAAAGFLDNEATKGDNPGIDNEQEYTYESFGQLYSYYIELVIQGCEQYPEFYQLAANFLQNNFMEFVKYEYLLVEFEELRDCIDTNIDAICEYSLKYLGDEQFVNITQKYIIAILFNIDFTDLNKEDSNNVEVFIVLFGFIEKMFLYTKIQLPLEIMNKIVQGINSVLVIFFQSYYNVKQMLNALTIQFKKQTKNKTESQFTEEDDMLQEDQEKLVEQVDNTISLLMQTIESITKLYSSQKGKNDSHLQQIQNYIFNDYVKLLKTNFINDESLIRVVICMACDIVEYGQYPNQNLNYIFNIFKEFMQSKNWEIRQSCAYGIGITSKILNQYPQKTQEDKESLLTCLKNSVNNQQDMQVSTPDSIQFAKDNISHAILLAIVNADYMDYNTQQSEIKNALQKYFPMLQDDEEMISFYKTVNQFLDQLIKKDENSPQEQKHTQILLGKENENLIKLLEIYNQGYIVLKEYHSKYQQYEEIVSNTLNKILQITQNQDEIIQQLQKNHLMKVGFLEFLDEKVFN